MIQKRKANSVDNFEKLEISRKNKVKMNSDKKEFVENTNFECTNKEKMIKTNLNSQLNKKNSKERKSVSYHLKNTKLVENKKKVLETQVMESKGKNLKGIGLKEKNKNLEKSIDISSKRVLDEKIEKDLDSNMLNSKDKILINKSKKEIESDDLMPKTLITIKASNNIQESILDKKLEKKHFHNEENENKNEFIKKEEFTLKTDNKKRIVNDFIIVKKISFLIQRKEISLKKKRAEEFFIFANDDYSEEDELFYLSKIKPKGLKNIGGVCYMNSTLQSFYHIKEFTNYFLKNKKKIAKRNGLITTGLLDVIEGLSKKGLEPYNPKKFKTNLIREDDSFKGSEGKDSGDLVLLILDRCHEELIDNYSDLQDMTLDQRKESILFLDAYLKDKEESSIIRDIFSYYIRVKNICFECGTIFYSISLNNIMVFSLEETFKMSCSDITVRNDERRVSIENCLSCFSFGGSFEKKEFFCQYCKKNSHLFSVKSFATLPTYLIMLMKRGKNEKFDCHVDFEENLDLKDSYINVEGAPKEKITKYTLLGGTILYGKGGYGHTVAFCKHFDGEYYIFNDTNFKKTSFYEIRKQKVYLLFYKKNKN